MSDTDQHRDDAISSAQPPDELAEGYWKALLQQGEFARKDPVINGRNDDDWHDSYAFYGDYGIETHDEDWDRATEIFDKDAVLELTATGYNKGGLLVTWNSLRGFVPASQLIDFPVDIDDIQRRSLLSRYSGKTLTLRIIELDSEKNRLIFSERAATVEAGQRSALLYKLQPGTHRKGTVTNLCDFGAFIDLGGVEGLIHISELSWGRVNHPRDVLHSGQEVTVHIMSVEPDDERIALSLKRLQPDPWKTVEDRYEVGEVVSGVITNVVDFGAFACIEDGLEGLIHISELAEGQFLHPRNVLKEGETITARILNIDGGARRLGLSLRDNQHSEASTTTPNGIFNRAD